MDRYEEALAKARAEYEKAREQGYTWLMGLLEGMFPELKESEDERIRRHLIDIVETYWGTTNDPGKAADLAWLEKQKELPTNDEMLRTLRTEYEKGRADVLKDLPRWKKAKEYMELGPNDFVFTLDSDGKCSPYWDTEVEKGQFYITESDIENLPKEDEK